MHALLYEWETSAPRRSPLSIRTFGARSAWHAGRPVTAVAAIAAGRRAHALAAVTTVAAVTAARWGVVWGCLRTGRGDPVSGGPLLRRAGAVAAVAPVTATPGQGR